MKNHVPKTHHRFITIPQVTKVAQCITDQTGYISFLGYGGIYDNGMNFHLTTNKEWAAYYYNKYLFNPSIVKKRLNSGVNYWKKNKAHDIKLIHEDARDNFDIDAWVEFTYRDNVNQCYYIYSFVANRKNADKAYLFYDIHRGKLLKFITYFKQQAAHLISEAHKPENLVSIPDYSTEGIENPLRNYAMELEQENPNTKISDREFEIMLIYAAGYTTKNIGEMLHKSEKTIESHVHSIKQKYGFPDRVAMKKYLIAKGHDGLEKFFFSYLPEHEHVH